jgi:murein L,D-transpeptidase YafK
MERKHLMKMITGIIAILCLFIPAFAQAHQCRLLDGIDIKTKQHRLYICESRKVVKEYKIAIGHHGIGKTRAGDQKTPLGLYALGQPRRSNRFTIFIPIHYPTSHQQSLGYTGKDVGIHGPFKLYSWLGPLNTWFDWTQGCIAVANNDQIAFISKWLNKHPQAQVLLT